MTQCVDFYQRVLARAVDKIFLKKLRFLSMKIGLLLGPPLGTVAVKEKTIAEFHRLLEYVNELYRARTCDIQITSSLSPIEV